MVVTLHKQGETGGFFPMAQCLGCQHLKSFLCEVKALLRLSSKEYPYAR